MPIEVLEKECRWAFSRASGPGGQHRNKVETAVTVEHIPTGVHGMASEKRSQAENRLVAMHRLRCALAVAVRHNELRSNDLRQTDPMSGDNSRIPSEAWTSYTKAGRIRVSEANQHFPAILSEALDALSEVDWEVSRAAVQLHVSATQLVKLLGMYAPALEELNRNLVARGRAPRSIKR